MKRRVQKRDASAQGAPVEGPSADGAHDEDDRVSGLALTGLRGGRSESAEVVLSPQADLTDPYGDLDYAVGNGDDFICFAAAVRDDGKIQLHAVLNSESGGFIEGFTAFGSNADGQGISVVDPCDAVAEAQCFVDAAINWTFDNDVRHDHRGWNQDPEYFVRAVARLVGGEGELPSNFAAEDKDAFLEAMDKEHRTAEFLGLLTRYCKEKGVDPGVEPDWEDDFWTDPFERLPNMGCFDGLSPEFVKNECMALWEKETSAASQRTEVEAARENVRVVLEDLGEGVSGEFNDGDPEDEPLLRFTVYAKPTQDWIDRGVDPSRLNGWDGEALSESWMEVSDASYCTNINGDLPLETRQRLAQHLLDEVFEAASVGESIKKLCERLSHIDAAWLDREKE